MRLDIRYHMSFSYPGPVHEAHNQIRVRPRDLPTQRLLAYRLTTSPLARVLSFTDYWGTVVEHFGHVRAHDRLEILAESAVETRARDAQPTASLATIDESFRLEHAELLGASEQVRWNDAIAEAARDALSGIDDADEALAAVVGLTRDRLTYQRDSTHIGISLPELVEGGVGVCQDFAHLMIGQLRAVGIPARYVSGYLFAADETAIEDADTDSVRVQTHAWVEAAFPGRDWTPVDPTNDQPVGERHVVVGHGRDYDDVAPVRGVYVGDVVPEVDAHVEMRRMEPVARTLTERPRRAIEPIAFDQFATEVAASQQQQQQ